MICSGFPFSSEFGKEEEILGFLNVGLGNGEENGDFISAGASS